jgi:hypothetical protein
MAKQICTLFAPQDIGDNEMTADWRGLNCPLRPDPSGRQPSSSKEISPCSEYTRYTVEGRFPGPSSDLASIIDNDSIGMIFLAGPFIDPRWSAKLGYGMAVIGEDTRIHLHGNGKYVIRRAMDREHAERCLDLLRAICRPVVFSTAEGRFLWEMLRDLSLGYREEGDKWKGELKWQYENDGDLIAEGMDSFREMDRAYGGIVDNLLKDGKSAGIEDVRDSNRFLLKDLNGCLTDVLVDEDPGSQGRCLGTASFAVLVRYALWEAYQGP